MFYKLNILIAALFFSINFGGSAIGQDATSKEAAQRAYEYYEKLARSAREIDPDKQLRAPISDLTSAECAVAAALRAIVVDEGKLFFHVIKQAAGAYKSAADSLEGHLDSYQPKLFYGANVIRLRENSGLPRLPTDKDVLEYLVSLARDSQRISDSIGNGTAQAGDLERLIQNSGDIMLLVTILFGGLA